MDRKLQRHRADSLRQHGFLVYIELTVHLTVQLKVCSTARHPLVSSEKLQPTSRQFEWIFRNGFQCWISGFLHHKPSTNFLTVADLRRRGCEFESRPWLLCIVRPLSVPSLRGRLMSTSESWGVNGHTTRGISPVLRLRPVSGWSSCTSSCAVPWALRLGKGLYFYFFYLLQKSGVCV